MADYININGNNIPIRAADPSNPIVGEIWYNTTTNALKARGATTVGAWASAPTKNTATYANTGGGVGVVSATAAFGGRIPVGPPSVASTTAIEEYNGSTWTSSANLNTVRGNNGQCGTQTAAIITTGFDAPQSTPGVWSPSAAVEEYDGSTATTVNNNGTASSNQCFVGSQTAAFQAGGYTPGGTPIGRTASAFDYDGTCWTSQTSIPGPQGAISSCGTSSSNVLFWGGSGSFPSTQTNTWNGSAYSTGGSLNTAGTPSGSGISTDGFSIGGNAPTLTTCELYDGTTWTTTTSLNSGKGDGGATGANPTSSVLAWGAEPSPLNGVTEEWTGPGVATTVTISSS